MPKNNYMTFWEHVGELRKRIIYTLLSILLFAIIGYFFSEEIKEFLMVPIDSQIEKNSTQIKSAYFTPHAPFMLYISISIFCGLFLSVPVIMYNILKFIKPAIKKGNFITFIFTLIFSIILFSKIKY